MDRLHILPKKKAYLVWILITTLFTYQSVLRILPNLLSESIMSRFGIGGDQFGWISGIFYVSYGVLHLPYAIMFQRFSARKVLFISSLIMSFSILVMILANNWATVVISRALLGGSAAGVTIGSATLIRVSFGGAAFDRMLGLMLCASFAFVTVIMPVNVRFLAGIGYEMFLYTFVVIGFVIALAMLTIPKKLKSDTEEEHSMVDDIKSVLRNRKIIFFAIMGGLLLGPMEGFADGWGGLFLKGFYKLESEKAVHISTLVTTGYAIGNVILVYIASKTNKGYGVLSFAATTIVLAYIYVLSGECNAYFMQELIFLSVGIVSGYQVIIISKCISYSQARLSSLVVCVTNMVMMSFGIVFHKLIGVVLEHFWAGELVDGVRVYSKIAWIFAIAIIPAGAFISFIGINTYLVYQYRKANVKKKVLLQ